jgi:site-specific DNA-adenine methylase|tara:strand:+ start:5950 stop:6240 length:291 start_codon:yes stop_codon:yes gene_type:complete
MKYLRQMIADFLRKLIKLDDYIEDRVSTEIRDLATCIDNRAEDIEEIRDLTNSNEYELNERPTFYDIECQVEELVSDWVNDRLEDIVERLKKLEDK